MSKEKKFNKKEYDTNYNKQHYTECKLRLKSEESDKINAFLESCNISKNRLFIDSVLYIIENNIDLSEK